MGNAEDPSSSSIDALRRRIDAIEDDLSSRYKATKLTELAYIHQQRNVLVQLRAQLAERLPADEPLVMIRLPTTD